MPRRRRCERRFRVGPATPRPGPCDSPRAPTKCTAARSHASNSSDKSSAVGRPAETSCYELGALRNTPEINIEQNETKMPSKKHSRRQLEAAANREAWSPLQADLAARRERMEAMGGPDRVEKYLHARGKLDARQRLDALFDPGSFREIGKLVENFTGIPAEGFVCGSGTVNGRTVMAGAEDFSVLGGSIGSGGTAKRFRIAELAAQEQVPLVMALEGAGHRLTETSMGRAPNDLLALADLSGQVPMVCLVLGASAGHGALAAPLSDFVIMTQSASMFTGGPPLVKAATGEDVTKEELGGARICTELAGSAHNVARTTARPWPWPANTWATSRNTPGAPCPLASSATSGRARSRISSR